MLSAPLLPYVSIKSSFLFLSFLPCVLTLSIYFVSFVCPHSPLSRICICLLFLLLSSSSFLFFCFVYNTWPPISLHILQLCICVYSFLFTLPFFLLLYVCTTHYLQNNCPPQLTLFFLDLSILFLPSFLSFTHPALLYLFLSSPQDEPSSGMDPRTKRHLWRIISEEVKGKCAVVLTSHRLVSNTHLLQSIITDRVLVF